MASRKFRLWWSVLVSVELWPLATLDLAPDRGHTNTAMMDLVPDIVLEVGGFKNLC